MLADPNLAVIVAATGGVLALLVMWVAVRRRRHAPEGSMTLARQTLRPSHARQHAAY